MVPLCYNERMENKPSTATTLSLRLTPEERQLIEDAAAKKGWKAANFLRVSALERAAHVLNLSRATTFDFSGTAKRLAQVLLAPRDVSVAHDMTHRTFGRLGEGEVLADLDEDPAHEYQQGEIQLCDFRPAPLTHGQVEELREAIRLGGTEFADELIVECRRLGSVASANLPPPIDPHNLKD